MSYNSINQKKKKKNRGIGHDEFTHQLHVLHINIKVEFLFCLTIMESKLSPKKKNYYRVNI